MAPTQSSLDGEADALGVELVQEVVVHADADGHAFRHHPLRGGARVFDDDRLLVPEQLGNELFALEGEQRTDSGGAASIRRRVMDEDLPLPLGVEQFVSVCQAGRLQIAVDVEAAAQVHGEVEDLVESAGVVAIDVEAQVPVIVVGHLGKYQEGFEVLERARRRHDVRHIPCEVGHHVPEVLTSLLLSDDPRSEPAGEGRGVFHFYVRERPLELLYQEVRAIPGFGVDDELLALGRLLGCGPFRNVSPLRRRRRGHNHLYRYFYRDFDRNLDFDDDWGGRRRRGRRGVRATTDHRQRQRSRKRYQQR